MKTNPTDRIYPIDGDPSQVFQGLTKREYFAALAMQNLQNVLLRKSGSELLEQHRNRHPELSITETIALLAVKQADSLIKVLNIT